MPDKAFASALFCIAYTVAPARIAACIEFDSRPQADAALLMAVGLGFQATVRRVRFNDPESFDAALTRMQAEVLHEAATH